MKDIKFENLINDFLDAKTYVRQQFFNSRGLVNYFNFVFNRNLIGVFGVLLLFSILEFSLPIFLNNFFSVEDLISKDVAVVEFLYIFLIIAAVSGCSFWVHSKLNNFTYGLVDKKRKQIFRNFFNQANKNPYLLVSKVLNIVDMLSLSVRKFALNLLQLLTLLLVFLFLVVFSFPSLILLLLSVVALNLLVIVVGFLFAKRFVNRNQTMRSILISETFYGFMNFNLLGAKLSDSYLKRLQQLSEFDAEFRAKRDTMMFFARSLLGYFVLGFVLCLPLLEVYFASIFAVLSLNILSYMLLGLIVAQMLYLSLEIGLFLPVTGIVSQILFVEAKSPKRLDLSQVLNIRFFSNYLKLNNVVYKNFELLCNSDSVNVFDSENRLNKYILEFKNYSNLRNLFVLVNSKKMRFSKFLENYSNQIIHFSRDVSKLYDLFSLDRDLDQQIIGLKKYDILEPVFKNHAVFKSESYNVPSSEFYLGLNFLRVYVGQPKMVVISKEDYLNSVLQKNLLKLQQEYKFILIVC